MRSVILFMLLLSLQVRYQCAFAEQLPPDSIIALLNDHCHQEGQLEAVKSMVVSPRVYYYAESVALPVTVYPIYNSNEVRTAFKEFVIDLVYGDLTIKYGSNFRGSYYLGFTPYEDADYEGSPTDLDLVLGLYISWGFKDSLFQVADNFITREPFPSDSFILLLNSLGVEYFTHLRELVLTDPQHTNAILTAQKCLKKEELLDISNRRAARNMIQAALSSKNLHQISMAIESDESKLWSDLELRADLLSALRGLVHDSSTAHGNYDYALSIAWRLYYPLIYRWGLPEYWEVLNLADSIIKIRAASTNPEIRKSVAGAAVMAYEADGWGMRGVIQNLLQDPDPDVRNTVRQKIQECRKKWDFEDTGER